MAKRNCPNCAAPYDVSLNKCPYCGTSYFDMSAIDFRDGEPMYLKIRYDGMVITQKVIPELAGIEINYETTYVYGGYGNMVSSFMTNQTSITDIKFKAIKDGENLITVTEDIDG